MASSIYDKYGGFGKISRIVMTFYEMALDSDQIGDHFAEVDMPRLIDHQTKFISALLGGPTSFGDDRLRQVHRHLELSHADMDEMSALLGEALTRHDMAPDDIDTVLRLIESKRPLIVHTAA